MLLVAGLFAPRSCIYQGHFGAVWKAREGADGNQQPGFLERTQGVVTKMTSLSATDISMTNPAYCFSLTCVGVLCFPVALALVITL